MPFNRAAALRCLHVLGKQKGFDHQGLHDLAATFFKKDPKSVSLGKLTNTQLGTFIAHLKATTKGAPILVPNGASKPQLWKIQQYEKQLGWNQEPERLAAFLYRQCKKDRLLDLTGDDARKVIDGLKNLAARAVSTSTND